MSLRLGMNDANCIGAALEIARRWSQTDGAHHKAWVLDQMVRALLAVPEVKKTAVDANGKPYSFEALGTNSAYEAFVREHNAGEDGPDTYAWDEGIPP